MYSRTVKKFLFMIIVFFPILLLNDVGWCVGQEKVVFINERKQPDGSYSIYGEYDIYIINSDGTGLKKLIEKGINPVPSPDGKMIAFIPIRILEDQLGISVIKTDGRERKDLVKRNNEGKDDSIFYCCFHWSPDSKKIAFVSSQRKGDKRRESLWVIDVVTRKLVELNTEIGNIPIISWSPESKEILLTIPNFTATMPDYMIIDIETGKKTVLPLKKYSNDQIVILMPEKSDKLIYFNYKDESLWIVNRDGSNNKKIGHVGKLPDVTFQKSTLDVLPNNKSLRFIAQESEDGTTIFKLYELNIQKNILNIKAKIDSSGLFSYSGTMLLTAEETFKESGKHQLKLVLKDLKNEKVYVLCSPWRIFTEEIFALYEHVNWISPISE